MYVSKEDRLGFCNVDIWYPAEGNLKKLYILKRKIPKLIEKLISEGFKLFFFRKVEERFAKEEN